MNAALRAVEKAVEETPPTVNSLRGTNTRTGEMKQHWVTDSRPRPVRQGDSYVSELNNDKQCASFVNDGHRMDRHFVPGLVINPGSGLLEFNPDGTGGIVVGTRTAYVPGLFMVDKAVEEYRRVLREELKGLEELME
ncbi:HK97 gp10 family phage protein [Flavonifractor plautii]|jgi:hypothetical protein|uniref:HK97 gp10 family phage protein n=1 Tax=Flavonifractor plautii TaxID=292800 RepID=UPI00321AAF4A